MIIAAAKTQQEKSHRKIPDRRTGKNMVDATNLNCVVANTGKAHFDLLVLLKTRGSSHPIKKGHDELGS